MNLYNAINAAKLLVMLLKVMKLYSLVLTQGQHNEGRARR